MNDKAVTRIDWPQLRLPAEPELSTSELVGEIAMRFVAWPALAVLGALLVVCALVGVVASLGMQQRRQRLRVG